MGKERTNWKWVLKDDPTTDLTESVLWAPEVLRNPSIGNQANTACLWAEVDPVAPHRWHRVKVVGTGLPVPKGSRQFLGRCLLTVHDRKAPTPVDNSVQHFYLVDESAEEAANALALPLKGPGAGEVIRVPQWAAAVAGTA